MGAVVNDLTSPVLVDCVLIHKAVVAVDVVAGRRVCSLCDKRDSEFITRMQAGRRVDGNTRL